MAWLPQYAEGKTPAELAAIAAGQLHVGSMPNVRGRNQWDEAIKAINPAIQSYIKQKQNAQIAAQLQAQQQQEDQQNEPMYDLQYQQEYRKAYPDQFPQSSAPNGKYPVTLPDGRTVYVTGNEAARINFRNSRGSAVDEKAKHFSESAPQTSAADINRMPPNDKQRPMTAPTPQDQGSQSKPLDADTAKALLLEAGGDKEKARTLAVQRGYSF